VIVVERVFGVLGLIVAGPIISTVLVVVEETWTRPNEERADAGDTTHPAKGARGAA
jgi:predicted PurR-regulated permease PerM